MQRYGIFSIIANNNGLFSIIYKKDCSTCLANIKFIRTFAAELHNQILFAAPEKVK